MIGIYTVYYCQFIDKKVKLKGEFFKVNKKSLPLDFNKYYPNNTKR